MTVSRTSARRALGSVVVLAVSLVALPVSARASWPGLNGRISLTQRVEATPTKRANRDIFAFPLDTDALRASLVTLTTDNEEQSSWSPDGQWVAYKRRDAVFVARWDGTGAHALTETVLTDDSNNTQPSWSADGKQIIFRSNRESAPLNVADIWAMDAPTETSPGGTNQHAILKTPGDERYPSMSPDGSKLLFRSDQDGDEASGDEEIFIADADGSNVRQLTHNAFVDSAPNWSPDGTRIAYEAGPDGENRDIFVMRANGSGIRQLTTSPLHDEGPTWSPDGRRIAFTRAETPKSPGDIWTMNADGTNQQHFTTTDIIEESPDWQPIPALSDVPGRKVACGDLSLAPGGIASVTAVSLPCWRALWLAGRWKADAGLKRFECTQTPHTFDQVVVQCTQKPARRGFRCRTPRERLAFVWRDPSPAEAVSRTPAPAAPVTDEPEDPEPVGPDDDLPRGEED